MKIAVVVVLFGGMIFFRDSRPVSALRTWTVVTLRPLMNAGMSLGRRLDAVTGGSSAQEVKDLIEQNQRLKAEEFAQERLRAENESLQKALGFKEIAHAPLGGARVLLYTDELGRESLLVDQGKDAGVKKGDIVIDENRLLVGEVSDVAETFSAVAIASNSKITFPAALVPVGGGALARGIGARAFAIELIPRGTPIRRGDFVARILPNIAGQERAILVGEIADEYLASSAAFASARATLLARPELLERVFIISLPK